MNFIKKMALFYGVFLFCSACAQIRNLSTAPPAGFSSAVTAEVDSQEIASLETIARDDPDPSARKMAHLQLARLHASYKNPARTYQKALEQLEIYASLEPQVDAQYDTQNWLAVLEELESLSQKTEAQNRDIEELNKMLKQLTQEKQILEKKNKKLSGASNDINRINSELKQENRDLTELNLKLQKTIDLLKNLDRSLEEKRKNFNH
jgi:DNA repair exonuclease SbcCD ATPase subunit